MSESKDSSKNELDLAVLNKASNEPVEEINLGYEGEDIDALVSGFFDGLEASENKDSLTVEIIFAINSVQEKGGKVSNIALGLVEKINSGELTSDEALQELVKKY